MALLLFLAAVMLTLAMGMPIAYSLLISGIVLMAWQGMPDPQIVAFTVINGNDSYALLAIPFFVLAGELMNAGGLSRRIVALAIHLVGHRHGGLGYVVIVVGIVLSTLSGSAVADAAAMAAFLIPMMKQDGYDTARSAGLVATAGLLGPIIPPSLALILYGVMSNTSVSRLFLAGVFPGLMMALVLALTWGWLMRREEPPQRPRAPLAEVARSLRAALWALGLPVIIILGLRFGVVTTTEAAVVSAVYSAFVAFVVYRELPLAELPRLALSAMMTSAAVMFIIACAMLGSWMIAVSGAARELTALAGPLVDSPRLLVAAVCLLVLLLGTALETGPILLILTPLVMPLVTRAGIDPVYFGIVYVLSGVIGMVTPPVGSVLAVVASVGKVEFATVTRGATPFMLSQVLLLGLMVLFPQLITVPASWLARP
ncbi:TRAP transporter large permease [Aquabacterium sp.]|uniref:TRAP transporter large permease n=1 Tax=Aquabacterium sp. TaxID=1872578 RepID=UPI002CA7D7B1|nr:TRAP transporter large permease subunit [Aquabacterium sp.]HSW03952.1 TRAP transporter large permease subunit [Aquabacterium sp.]